MEFNNVDEALMGGEGLELDWCDTPPLSYFDSPNHNPPGIPSVGMEWICSDGRKRCPCICHCVFCNSGVNPDRARHGRYYY